MMFYKTSDKYSTDFLLQLDSCNLYMLMLHTAACIVAEITSPQRPAEQLLKAACNWADHGFTNALQYQVSLLYESVKLFNSGTGIQKFTDKQEELICKALKVYQDYKTDLINQQKKEMNCAHFGDSTGFNKMDWTDVCKEFKDANR